MRLPGSRRPSGPDEGPPHTRSSGPDGASGGGPEGEARRRIRRLRRRVDTVQASLGSTATTVQQHDTDIASLARFAAGAAEELAELRHLLDHVRAIPAEHHAPLRVTGPRGTVMGYVDERAGEAEQAYVRFEAVFRGTREELQQRQVPYLPLVQGRSPLLDLGCGRGEFLELLLDQPVEASGVDLDPGMVAVARERGTDAQVGDLFDELARHGDASVGAVVSFQVVEHLSPPDMRRMLREVRRVLRPDGIAVIETVNPHALRAYRLFWLDLTHTVPVFPESLLHLADEAGFTAAVAFFAQGGTDLAADLREQGDYALVCARDPAVLVECGLLVG